MNNRTHTGARQSPSAPIAEENEKSIGAIRWTLIILLVLSLVTFFCGRGIVDTIASIDLCLFFVLCAMWRIVTIQNRNSGRIIELLEQQNRILRGLGAKPQPAQESAKTVAPQRAGSPYDTKTDDGRFVI